MSFRDAPKPHSAGPARAPRTKCGAPKRSGGLCNADAGAGTDHLGYGHCKLHMGNTPTHRRKAALMEAHREAVVMGFPIDIDPMEGLLTVIKISAGEIAYMTDRIAELTPKQAVVRHKKTVSRDSDMESYEEIEKSSAVSLNIWISARHQSMERFARFCKMAIDAGVAERSVAVAEGIGQQMGHLISGVLGELGLTDQQKELAPQVVQKHLLLLESGTKPVSAAEAERILDAELE